MRDAADAPWRVLVRYSAEESVYPIIFSADGRKLYLASDHDANTSRLLLVELATGTERALAEEEGSDISGWNLHPVTQKLQAVCFNKEREVWRVLDEEIAADFAAISTACHGDFILIAHALADDVWIVADCPDDRAVFITATIETVRR